MTEDNKPIEEVKVEFSQSDVIEQHLPEDKHNSNGKKIIIGSVMALLVVVFFGFRNWSQPEEVMEEPEVVITEEGFEVDANQFPDYALALGMSKLELVKNFTSWTPHSTVVNAKTKLIRISSVGEISKAYIYLKANVEGQALSKYESFYLKFNNTGGHLFRPYTLALPDSTVTELLYPLERISYLPSIPYSEAREASETDWLALLANKNINIFTFISSLKPATIEELSIYYDCVDDLECALDLL